MRSVSYPMTALSEASLKRSGCSEVVYNPAHQQPAARTEHLKPFTAVVLSQKLCSSWYKPATIFPIFLLASLLHNIFSHCCEPTPKFLEFIVQLYRQVESSEARLRWWHRSISEAGRENPWSKFLYHPRNQFSVAGESADWRLWYVWIIIQLQHS